MINRITLTPFASLVCLLLTGCPELGIPNPTANNSITIVNDLEANRDISCDGGGPIDFFGVSRVICGEERPDPANVLPSLIEVGSEFTVDGLPDGEYIIRWNAHWDRESGSTCVEGDWIRQSIEGGTNLRIFARD